MSLTKMICGENYTTELLKDNVNGLIDVSDAHQASIDALEENKQSGVIVFQTYTLLDAYSPTVEQQDGSFKVVNDADSAKNGYYSWVSGTAYTKDADLVVNKVDEENSSDAVSGKAVFNHSAYIANKKADLSVGKNLYNKDAATTGYYMSNLGVAYSHVSFSHSDLIYVESGETYVCNQDIRYSCYFDINGEVISGGTSSTIRTFTVPENAVYIIVTLLSAVNVQNLAQLEIGSTATDYESYIKSIQTSQAQSVIDYLDASMADSIINYVDETNQTSSVNGYAVSNAIAIKADANVGKNLFDKSAVTTGFYYNSAGQIISNTGFGYSEKIAVTAGESYVSTYNMRFICCFDVDGNVVAGGSEADTKAFTVPVGVTHIIVTISSSVNANNIMQLEIGTVSTDYESYAKSVPLSQLKNATDYADDAVEALRVEFTSDPDAFASMEVILPEKYPVLHGTDEQANIYFNYAVRGIFSESNIEADGLHGVQLGECVRIEPTEESLSIGDTFDVTITAQDEKRNPISTATTEVNIVNPVCASDVRLCVIGDSITRGGQYTRHVIDKLTNVTPVGTRVYYQDGDAPREGRGGWSLRSYLTSFKQSLAGDSPFLVPTGVSGALYFGNTRQWQRIVMDLTEYEFDGFQLLAKDWDWNGDYQYDITTGRRLNPPTGAVMFDEPTYKFIEYDGSAWVEMTTQPEGYEVSFAAYMARFAVAFTGGAPTHISIMSGANDFQGDDDGTISDAEWDEYSGYLDQLIDSIHDYDPTIKILVGLPIGNPAQDGAGQYKNLGLSAYTFNNLMQDLAKRIIAKYDGATNRANGIYITPFLQSLDPVGGWPYETVPRNKYATDLTVNRLTEMLHPRNAGYYQLGDCLAAVVSYTS